MMTVIDKAAALATAVDVNPVHHMAELEDLRRQRARLLPAEVGVRHYIDARATEIARDLDTYNVGVADRDIPLPVLDQEVLTWRQGQHDRTPCPTVALVDVHNRDGYCQFRYGGHGSFTETVPSGLQHHYKDVRYGLSKHRGSEWGTTASLTFTYNGAIPAEVRNTIVAEKGRFDGIYLLVESPTDAWSYVGPSKREIREAKARVADPLVLGYDTKSNNLYLLDQFDPTPIEQYIAMEFMSQKQLTSGT